MQTIAKKYLLNMSSWYKAMRSCFVVTFFSLFLMLPSALRAENPPESELQTGKEGEDKRLITIEKSTETFEYQIEGRADPFLPFISERSTTTRNENPDEIIEDNQALTGMQLFEPSQLTLVALMSTGGSKFAMVQDFTGKGYIIKEGTKIGRRGVVKEIADNKVIISETARTRGGKTLTNNIAMVLKKEGEE